MLFQLSWTSWFASLSDPIDRARNQSNAVGQDETVVLIKLIPLASDPRKIAASGHSHSRLAQ
jgi:hypothetical protein